MGASNTRAYGIGKDAATAYARAMKDAQHEYGHDPYSGTIAAMGGGFVPVTLPPRMTLDKFENLLGESELVSPSSSSSAEYIVEEVRWAERDVREAKPGMKRQARARLTKAKKDLAKGKRDRERFEAKLAKSGIDSFDFQRWAETYNDKWGPPLCVEVRGQAARQVREWRGVKRGKVFAFIGYAPT